MAESPVRHRTLAPFGGITRIRFKGSPAFRQTLSHCGSPALCFLARIRLACAKSITCIGSRHVYRCRNLNAAQSAMQLPAAKLLTRIYPAGFAAVSSFMFVWKMANHAPFSFFQTDPEL
jgi:hypothetical protein